jgi:hypothetical protein
MNDPKNQRRNPRIDLNQEIVFRTSETITGWGIDLGAGGIGAQLPVELAVGTKLEVEIFPGHASAYGEVRWCKPRDGGFRVGIQFSSEDWSIIEVVQTLRSQEG